MNSSLIICLAVLKGQVAVTHENTYFKTNKIGVPKSGMKSKQKDFLCKQAVNAIPFMLSNKIKLHTSKDTELEQ